MSEKQTFETFDLSPSLDDYRRFLVLSQNPDFIHWRQTTEDFQIQRVIGFLKGMDLPQDIKHPTEYFRGGYDMYTKLFRIVDRAEEMIKELQND